MRKFACTASVFSTMLIAVTSTALLRVKNTVWWDSNDHFSSDKQVPLLIWLIQNVGVTIVVAAGLMSILCALWAMSSAICQSLSRRFGRH
jgi:hypothetical protein